MEKLQIIDKPKMKKPPAVGNKPTPTVPENPLL